MKKTILHIPVYVLVISLFPIHSGAQGTSSKPDMPNVLFIAVDDLRPELGCYGKPHIQSPNIDRLAMSGFLIHNAYVNFPVCGPSRASIMSGIYTSHDRWLVWNCSQDAEVPGLVSLPMHFRNNGYQTVSLGKVYNNFDDGKGSWDRNWTPPVTNDFDYQSVEGTRLFEELNKESYKNMGLNAKPIVLKWGLPYEGPEISDEAYGDGKMANRAIEELQHFQNSGEPFFLALGFYSPHLPFNAPRKYWDLYDENDIELPSNHFFPKNAPDEARFNWGELRAYHGIPKEGLLPDSTARKLIHGYYACVSYVDAQIGRVLNALEWLGLADETIVILWGDNGWFLGEHGFWSKHSNFEKAAHAPLIVRVPWNDPGKRTEALVEFVDIYPTLCELAGLSLPFHLQGKSFVPLMDDPGQSWKEVIYYRRSGETILTQTHAYTEWIDYEKGQVYARMLYDHRIDPEENVNVAELPENRKLIESLHTKLHLHIKSRDQLVIP